MGNHFSFGGPLNDRVSVCSSIYVLESMEKKYLIRGVLVLLFFLVVWVLYVSSKQIERNRRIEQEVSSLQGEADRIRRENENLSEKISYFSSADFKEQEAKEKLGMKKTDESVVVIKPRPEETENTAVQKKESSAPATKDTLSPNYRKWWRLFFQQM